MIEQASVTSPLDGIGAWIAATAAVGTAAMGLVEALKVVNLGGFCLATIGLDKIRQHLGSKAIEALGRVYGVGAVGVLLEGAWRKSAESLAQTLRNGLRMAAFMPANEGLATAFGQDPAALADAVKTLSAGSVLATQPSTPMPVPDFARARELVARLEAAIDARVEAAVAAAVDSYTYWMRFLASVMALAGSVAFGAATGIVSVPAAVLVGLLAVPIAPIAKDLVGFLNSLRAAFAARAATR